MNDSHVECGLRRDDDGEARTGVAIVSALREQNAHTTVTHLVLSTRTSESPVAEESAPEQV